MRLLPVGSDLMRRSIGLELQRWLQWTRASWIGSRLKDSHGLAVLLRSVHVIECAWRDRIEQLDLRTDEKLARARSATRDMRTQGIAARRLEDGAQRLRQPIVTRAIGGGLLCRLTLSDQPAERRGVDE